MTTVTVTKTFSYTGSMQSWTVPDGITSITVTCNGAGSGAVKGGKSVLTVPVSTGRVVNVFVGDNAFDSSAGGWNGGGPAGSGGGTLAGAGGAGATDVRIGGTALSDRIVVAGGAGGYNHVGTNGGAGGGTTGADGAGSQPGHGGSQTAGGAAGTGGTAGSTGQGGTGSDSDGTNKAGAGGGGGYYGGGGSGLNSGAGAAGGGSGYYASTSPDGATSGGSTTQGTGNTGSGSVTIAYDLDVTAPSDATLTSPTSGQVLDATDGVSFKLTYHATDGQDCNAATLRLKIGTGAYSYYKASDSTWSSTEVWNTLTTPVADGGTIEFDVPASATIANGNSFNWSANTQESGANLQGIYAPDSTFTARTPPAVNITSPTGGTANVTSPPAEWTAVLAPGTTQTQYHVVWESGAYSTVPGSGTSVADTGVVNSAAGTAPCPATLTNGTAYRMFVQLWETGGEDSGWAYVTFTVQVTPPSTPVLTLTPGTDVATGAPTVTVLATVADGAEYDHTDTTVQVQASVDGGATWVPVRDIATNTLATALALDASGQATVIDAEALFGSPTLYRANATGTASGLTITGAWSDPVTATLDVTQCWIIDPLDLSTALHVPVRTDDTRTRTITQDITATLGSAEPVISSDVRQLQTGSFTWSCPDKATRDALEALLTNGRTLLQRAPAEQDDSGMHVYFRPTGDITTDRLAQSPIPVRLVRTGWAQRSRP